MSSHACTAASRRRSGRCSRSRPEGSSFLAATSGHPSSDGRSNQLRTCRSSKLEGLSFAKTRSSPVGDSESVQATLASATPPQPGTAFVSGERVHRAGRARWMRGRDVPRRTKTSRLEQVRQRGGRTGCKPPTSGRPTTSPISGDMTAPEAGASLLRERCVRERW